MLEKETKATMKSPQQPQAQVVTVLRFLPPTCPTESDYVVLASLEFTM